MNIAVYGLGRAGGLFFRFCHGSKTKNFILKLLAYGIPFPLTTKAGQSEARKKRRRTWLEIYFLKRVDKA